MSENEDFSSFTTLQRSLANKFSGFDIIDSSYFKVLKYMQKGLFIDIPKTYNFKFLGLMEL